jgi:hypothetical protein
MPDDAPATAHGRSVARGVARTTAGDLRRGGNGDAAAAHRGRKNGDPPFIDPKPRIDLKCGDQLESWNVTRQFDFGQFVILHKEETVDGKRIREPIVLSGEGDLVLPEGSVGGTATAADSVAGAAAAATNGAEALSGRGQPSAREVLGGVPLHLIFQESRPVRLLRETNPVVVEVEDLGPVLRGKPINTAARDYHVNLDDQGRERLLAGQTITVLGRVTKKKAKGKPTMPALFQLKAKRESVPLNQEGLNAVLASRKVALVGSRRRSAIALTAAQVDALLDGMPTAVVATAGTTKRLVELHPEGQPADQDGIPERFAVTDLGRFIAEPFVSINGMRHRVPLRIADVKALRENKRRTVTVEGIDVEFALGDPKDLIGYKPMPDGGSGPIVFPPIGGQPPVTVEAVTGLLGGGSTSIPDGWQGPRTEPVPQSLPVAIFLPWRQQWRLEGLSKGTLLSSLVLGPGGEATIALHSWERWAKALEQSTEMDVEQLLDYTSTTRDSEDVLNETKRTNEFQFEIGGGLDASYNTAVASINVNVDGKVTNASALETVARKSTLHLTEIVSRASTKVRSRRVTKIVETQERGSTELVTKHFRNPNGCNDLTHHFHEVLAHYSVNLTFQKTHVGVVVLVPNPLGTTEFESLTVRANEEALRLGLLNRSLVDGFEAARTLASYDFAHIEAKRLAAAAKELAELDRQREEDAQSTTVKPPPAQEKQLLATLADVAAAAKRLQPATGSSGELPADIRPAMNAIAAHQTPLTESLRSAGQRWLFRALVQSKVAPGFLTKLDALAAMDPASLAVDHARQLVDVIPTGYPTLETLNGLTEVEKEDHALKRVIDARPGLWTPFKWNFWTGALRQEGLYTADDAGLAGLCASLKGLWLEYQTKSKEGDALLAQEELAAKAGSKQDEASYVDKLEMKYGLEVVASAQERWQALRAHLDKHADYYRYVLFQAQSPGEQLDQIMRAAPHLLVGMFEPHVVAQAGKYLAVPLTPIGRSKLNTMVTDLTDRLDKAASEALKAAEGIEDEHIILPTPGMAISSHLGTCSACGDHEEAIRAAQLRQAKADADAAEAEAQRRWDRLDANPPELDYDPQPLSARLAVEGIPGP